MTLPDAGSGVVPIGWSRPLSRKKPEDMSDQTPQQPDAPNAANPDFDAMTRDIAEVPAVEVITTVAVHLMSSAAVNLGLAEEGAAHKDLDEARKLIQALAGLVTASATEIGSYHAAPLRDGLKSLQLAFREASVVPDEPGQGPGEKYTAPSTAEAGPGHCRPETHTTSPGPGTAGARRVYGAPGVRVGRFTPRVRAAPRRRRRGPARAAGG